MRPQVIMPQPPAVIHLDRYEPYHLRYSAKARCSCGAGLAYPVNNDIHGAWICSAVLLGAADISQLHDRYDFISYSVKSEANSGMGYVTTRPIEQGRVLQKTIAECSCGHAWEKGPYEPKDQNSAGLAGACAECGNTNGAGIGATSGPGIVVPIKCRFMDYLLLPDGTLKVLQVESPG